jgi:hypothetical protein
MFKFFQEIGFMFEIGSKAFHHCFIYLARECCVKGTKVKYNLTPVSSRFKKLNILSQTLTGYQSVTAFIIAITLVAPKAAAKLCLSFLLTPSVSQLSML